MGTQAVMKYFFKMSWHSQGECIETVLSRSSLTPCRQLVEEWHSDVQKNPKHPLYQIMQQRKKISSQEEGERGETPSLQQHFHKDLWTRESLIAFLSSDFIQGDFRFLWTWKDIRVEWVIDVLDCPGEACPWKEEYLQISTRVVQQLRAISVSTPFLAQIPLALKMCVLQLWKRRFRLFEPLPLCLPREWVLDRSFCQAFLNGRMEFQRKNKTKGDVVSPDPSAPLSSQSLLSQQRQEQEQSQKRKPARSENQNGNENQEEEEVEEVEEEEEEKASPLVSIFEASEHRKICLGRGVSPAWFAQIEENGHERSTYDPYFRFTDNPTICFYSPAERACMGYNDPVVQATAHKFAEMWDQYFIEIEYDQDWTHILHPQEEGERERKSDKKKELEREDSQDDVPRSLSLFETQKDDGGRKKEEQIDRHLADLFTYSVHAPFVSALEYERIDVQVGRRGKEFPLSFQAPSHLLFLFPRIWGKEAIAQTSMFLRDVTPRLDVVSALSHTEEDLTQNHLPMVFLSSVWLGSIRKAVSDYMHLEPSSKKIWEETARSVFDQEGRLRSPLPPEKEYILVGPHNGLVLARTRQLRHCFHCWVWLEYTWAKINRAHHPFDPLVFNYPELCMEKWKFDFDAMGRAQKQQVIRRFEKVVEEEIRRLVVDVVSTVKKEEQWNDFPLVDHTDPPSQ
uniref:Uncharacterized protein n=2 Tax=Palpitomonas bilix TaxID=652834 RepID=A0A7S3D6I3_9EUKA|mmetsp:Transcript_23941/g.60600  ORF Transcript_23941/g.60600 Transcript_23941/m.60600 type:complete len:681 (+) Transcript_23941:2601-4643(+)